MKQEEEELLMTFIHSEYFLDQPPIKNDEPKKKRGRKKHEPCNQSILLPLAPKPMCTIQPELNKEEIKIKKKQERLIKNRAAALQSRKRKRDHLQTLEQDNKKLMQENDDLTAQLKALQEKFKLLEQENIALKTQLQQDYTPVMFMLVLLSFTLFGLSIHYQFILESRKKHLVRDAIHHRSFKNNTSSTVAHVCLYSPQNAQGVATL